MDSMGQGCTCCLFSACPAPPMILLHPPYLCRCYKLNLGPADWRQLLRSLPRLRLLRHSCQLLAAEVRGHGGAAQLAAALGACPQLQIEQHPPPRTARPPDPRTVQLFEEMLQAARQEAARGRAAAGGRSGSGSGAGLAAAPAGPGGGTVGASGRLSRSYGSLDQLEQGAAAALLGGGGGGSSDDGSSDYSEDDGATNTA